MPKDFKIDTPTLLRRIIEEARLGGIEKETVTKFNRHQLVELYMYITELKKTNKELSDKIQDMNLKGDEDDSGEESERS